MSIRPKASSTEIDQVIARSIECVVKFVVPLYVEVPPKPPVLLGTGFFVQFGTHVALCSAAHVLKQASNERPLLAYRRPNDVVQIAGKRFLSDPNGLDLGFVLTEGIGLPWREVDKFACPLQYLQPGRTPRATKRYVVAGYPETKNRANPIAKTFNASVHAYHANSIADEHYGEIGLDPGLHVALPLDLRRGSDPEGRLVHFPKPQGMSGSPIWELLDESDANQPRTFPLVAVATTYKKKVLWGTDVGYLIPRILAAA